MDGCARFGPRFVRLGLALAVIEGAIALGYATAIVQAYRGFVSVADSWWIAPAVVAVSMAALAVSIVAELVYRLAQLVLVIEDAPGVEAVRGALPFVRRDALVVARICVAALMLSTLAFAVTLVAAAAFGFVSFVPVAGVAVLPLQAAVWVVRGLMLPFIELAALAAYAAAYRRPDARPAAWLASSLASRPGGRSVGGVAAVEAGSGVAGIPGGGAGTATGVPGITVSGDGAGSNAPPRRVQHALLRHQEHHVVEQRGAGGDERPGRQRLERDAAGVGRQRDCVAALVGAGLPIDHPHAGPKPVTSTLWPVTIGPPAGRKDSSCRQAWAPLPILKARTDWSSITAMTRSSSTARPIAAPWMRNRQRTRPLAESRA